MLGKNEKFFTCTALTLELSPQLVTLTLIGDVCASLLFIEAECVDSFMKSFINSLDDKK